MAELSLEEIRKATGARVENGGDILFKGIVTDTRIVGPGNLFLALRGERFNGEDFIGEAVEKGAAGVVVHEDCPREKLGNLDAAVFFVPDTLLAYQAIAHAWRMKFDLPLAAITGSNGKTTTKDLTASVLAVRWPVLKTEANFNNEIGLPQTLLQLDPSHRAAVVEIGMRGLGQIAALAPVAAPTIGVITNVGETHMELLGSMENIARAKGEMAEAIQPGGTVILNDDDPRVVAMRGKVQDGVRVVTFGTTGNADIRGGDIVADGSTTRFTVSFDGAPPMNFTLPMAGQYNVYNALAALAVGYVLELSPEEMRPGLAAPDITGKRFEKQKIGDITVINDAYNASPASMKAALETLRDIAPGRKIAVLGDMLELGTVAVEAHRRVGEQAVQNGIAVLLTRGELGKEIARSAEVAGLKEVYHCGSHEEAGRRLKELLQPGDTVLFKGSHSMAMDEIIGLL